MPPVLKPVLLFLIAHSTCCGRTPVEFDASEVVPMAETTSAEFSSAHPGKKTVRGRLAVSLFAQPGTDVTDALYQLYVVEGAPRIVDYSPRTQFTTLYVGEIDVTRDEQKGNQASISGSAQLEHWLSANASAGQNESSGVSSRYKLRPPVETSLTAGTSNRGRGVYFHFRESAEAALAGEKELEFEFRVPQSWRAGYLRVFAQASDQRKPLGDATFLVPLHLLGDEEAHELAEQLLVFEERLRAIAMQNAAAVRDIRRPTLVQELALRKEALPHDWLDQLVWRTSTSATPSFARRLPSAVRLAAADFHTAKRLVMASTAPPVERPLRIQKAQVDDRTQLAETGWSPVGPKD